MAELNWYRVSDNHSGGGLNSPYDWYQIQAPSEELAIVAWEAYTRHDITEVACQCCGPSFSIYEVAGDELFSEGEEDTLTLTWEVIAGRD